MAPFIRLRKQVIQSWWIVVFVVLQTFALVYISVELPPTTFEIFVQVNQEQASHSPRNEGESRVSVQNITETIHVGEMIVDSELQKMERRLMKRLNATSVSSGIEARRVITNNKTVTNNICERDNTNKHIVAYNPASYPRVWCGTTIPAKSFHLLTRPSCKEPPHVSQVEPTVDGRGMPPIHVAPYMPHIILSSFQNKKPRNVANVACDIPCKKTVGGDVFSGTDYRIVGTEIKILHSMESAEYYGNLRVKSNAYRERQYYSTTSFLSEIPVPYLSIDNDDIAQPAVEYDAAIRGASFLAKNCDSKSHREELVKQLMNYTRIDSLSSCLHTVPSLPMV